MVKRIWNQSNTSSMFQNLAKNLPVEVVTVAVAVAVVVDNYNK